MTTQSPPKPWFNIFYDSGVSKERAYVMATSLYRAVYGNDWKEDAWPKT